MIGELNDIIEDDKTGGGMIGGHRLTLGMHLLRHLKSARKVPDLLNEKFPSLEEIKCINYFHQQLKVYLLLFLLFIVVYLLLYRVRLMVSHTCFRSFQLMIIQLY